METTVPIVVNDVIVHVEPDSGAGYTPLNIHEIWLRLLLGEHLLYIRAKMTSFVNSLD